MTFVSVMLVVGVASAQDDTFTGCLTSDGNLTKVALGDEPVKPCTPDETQVSWSIHGPKGDKGEKGDTGDPGAPGAPGEDGRDGRNSGKLRYQFVGTSAGLDFLGNAGVVAMNDACNETFPGSRMCTSLEILETSPEPPIDHNAWVRPVIAGMAEDWIVDVSGSKSFRITPAVHAILG